MLLLTDGDVETAAESLTDCLARPFRFSTLLQRLHALNTHHAPANDAGVRIGPYTFHPSAKLLQARGARCG